jgi:hypothetical protein
VYRWYASEALKLQTLLTLVLDIESCSNFTSQREPPVSMNRRLDGPHRHSRQTPVIQPVVSHCWLMVQLHVEGILEEQYKFFVVLYGCEIWSLTVRKEVKKIEGVWEQGAKEHIWI